MKLIKKILLSVLLTLFMVFSFAACKPYDKPDVKTISASQTAFKIPLTGDTTKQAVFKSEDLLEKSMVASKRVTMEHDWLQQGYTLWDGKYIDKFSLLIVERKPETRNWTSDSKTGTNKTNEAISAESKESIGFSVGMNCTAEILPEDAPKFLFHYNEKKLSDIMDDEIRSRIEADFVEQCSNYSLTDLLLHKTDIMKSVRDDVTTYFKGRGISITVLGMKDGISYDSKDIQTSINEKFSSEQKIVTQKNENDRVISEATAKAKANAIIDGSLTDKLIEQQKVAKWNGQVPQVQGGNGNTLFAIDGSKTATPAK